jgi:uncharacterized protein YceH (UPF0502 family)
MVAGSFELGAVEQRILGCLLEKQRTTPDVYPLSLNSLRLACNQSTNRDPVVDYDDATLRDGLHRLERRGLVRLASGAGSRAAKYRHLLEQALPLDDAQQALVCVLLLRGAQTPGELKQRTERMHAFASLADVHAALDELIARGLARRHERRPGQKEDRYSHLLAAEDEPDTPGDNGAGADHLPAAAVAAPTQRAAEPDAAGTDLASLAARVARLERELAELAGRVAGDRTPADGATVPATDAAQTTEAAPPLH